jgi:hypothetical protein
MTGAAITLQSTVVATRDQVSADLGDEVAILGVAGGRYYTVGDVAARIWSLVQQPVTVAGLVAILVDEYEVAPGQLGADVVLYLEELAGEGLVAVTAPGGG